MYDIGLPIVSCSCPILREMEVQKEMYPSGVDQCTVYRLADDKFCCGQEDLHPPSFGYYIFNDILIILTFLFGVGYGCYHLHSRFNFFKKLCNKNNKNVELQLMKLNEEQLDDDKNDDDEKNTIVLDEFDD